MGAGSDVAIESAGVTLLGGDLQGIVRARKLSKAVMSNIRQNLVFAFGYNALGIPVAAGLLYPIFGLLLSPALAALAMALSSVSVIGNAPAASCGQTLTGAAWGTGARRRRRPAFAPLRTPAADPSPDPTAFGYI